MGPIAELFGFISFYFFQEKVSETLAVLALTL